MAESYREKASQALSAVDNAGERAITYAILDLADAVRESAMTGDAERSIEQIGVELGSIDRNMEVIAANLGSIDATLDRAP